jgi:hypothetical protein
VLNSHCSIPFRGVKIFASTVPERLSFLRNGNSVSCGKASGQFIWQTKCRHAESDRIIRIIARKSCVVTNTAATWIFQNNNKCSDAWRYTASQNCSVEVDFPLCHNQKRRTLTITSGSVVCVSPDMVESGPRTLRLFPCSLSQGDTSQSTAICQLIIITILLIYLLSNKNTFSGICLLGFLSTRRLFFPLTL